MNLRTSDRGKAPKTVKPFACRTQSTLAAWATFQCGQKLVEVRPSHNKPIRSVRVTKGLSYSNLSRGQIARTARIVLSVNLSGGHLENLRDVQGVGAQAG